MSYLIVKNKKYIVKDESTISVVNSNIYVDGKLLIDSTECVDKLPPVIRIEVKGNLLNLTSDTSVAVEGNVIGNVTAGGSVRCRHIDGNVITPKSQRRGNIVEDVPTSKCVKQQQ